MHAIADICVIPIHGKLSVRNEIALAVKILAKAGLDPQLHAYGTTVEGDMSAIFSAIQQIHSSLHADNIPRVHTTIKIGTRTDKIQNSQDKIDAVQELLKP